jgi:hypothetical protein
MHHGNLSTLNIAIWSMLRLGRQPRLLGLLLLFATTGCVSHSEDACQKQSDCDGHGFCGGAGFCESECIKSTDCPCGSFCAPGCNICVRDDLAGPATCFAFNRGMTVAEVLGVCRSGFGDAQEVAPACFLDPVTLTACMLNARVDSGATSTTSAGGQDAAVGNSADTAGTNEGGEG